MPSAFRGFLRFPFYTLDGVAITMKQLIRRFFGKSNPSRNAEKTDGSTAEPRSSELETLEPRMLFSAAPVSGCLSEKLLRAWKWNCEEAGKPRKSRFTSPISYWASAALPPPAGFGLRPQPPGGRSALDLNLTLEQQ